MAFTIQEMTSGNNGIVLRCNCVTRLPVITNGWTRFRLGFSVQVLANASTLLGGFPRFEFGLCGEADNGPTLAEGTIGHFVGIRTNIGNWIYSEAGTSGPRVGNMAAGTQVGASNTLQTRHAQNGVVTTKGFLDSVSTAAVHRWAFGALGTSTKTMHWVILEFNKVAGPALNVSLARVATTPNSTSDPPQVPVEVAYSLMESGSTLSSAVSSLFPSGYSAPSTDYNIPIDEGTYGALVKPCFGWSLSSVPLAIGNILAAFA